MVVAHMVMAWTGDAYNELFKQLGKEETATRADIQWVMQQAEEAALGHSAAVQRWHVATGWRLWRLQQQQQKAKEKEGKGGK